MTRITCPDHQNRLLKELDRLREECFQTDVILESKEGNHHNVHHIVMKALNISDYFPPQHLSSTVSTGLSSSALDIVVTYLYRGILDLSSASAHVIEDVHTFAKQYHMYSLQQLLQDEKLGAATEITQPSPPSKHPDSSTPVLAQHKPVQCTDIVMSEQFKIDVKENAQNVHTKCSRSSSTKVMLKAFLDKKENCKESTDMKPRDLKQGPQSPLVVCCDICGKIIAQKGFPAHMRIHYDIKDKTCEVCGKQFRKACNLREHWQRMHSVSKHYSCGRCGANFTIKSDLKRHVARHQKTCFVCELCGASFVGKMMWKKHKCMDDIFNTDALDTVFGKDNSSNAQPSSHNGEMDNFLEIDTYLPLGPPEMTGCTEILSEIDGLFYDNSVMLKDPEIQ